MSDELLPYYDRELSILRGLAAEFADRHPKIAGRLALQYTDEMNERVALLVSERDRIGREMRRLPIDVFDSGANFVLFRPRGVDGRQVWQGLVDRSVLVRDCSSWPRLDNCLRVTVGTPDENDSFLHALELALGDLSSEEPS